MATSFDKNTKIITVLDPATTITVQDLHDDIRIYEADNSNLEITQIANASGKQDLGGGVRVGITLELINDWRLAFEERDGPDTVLCTVSGGNLVATNQYGNTAIFPTAFTQVIISQSSSATISDASATTTTNIMYMLESMRTGGNHAGVGSIYYWDPTGGSDTNNGTTPLTAVATFSKAQTLATAGNNDIIFCLANDAAGINTVTEVLAITKNNLKVRGPGFNFQLVPAVTNADTITISADNVEVSGLYIETASSGSRDGIVITGDNALVKDCWIANVRGNGINISSATRTRIETCAIEDCGNSGTGDGIKIGDTTTRSLISKCVLYSNVNGAALSGTGISDNIFENNLIYANSGYGILIGSGVARTGVRSGHTFSNNGSGSTNDSGSNTFIETPAGGASATDIADAVWDELITDHLAANSTGKTLRDAKTRATLASLK
jgi:hypothetical protein